MTTVRVLTIAAALMLAFGGAVQAACQDQVAQLEDRLAQLEGKGGQEQQSTQVETSSGEVQLEAQSEGSAPKENWFGSSASVEGAEQELDNARTAADNGNEDMCRQHVEQAQKILDALEG